MATFLSLAPELVDCVGQYCELREMQNLRLTCKYLADQFESGILHTLSFDINRDNIGKPMSKIRFLARNPASTPSRAVRHLNLGSLSSKHDTANGEFFGTFEDSLVPYPLPPFSPRILAAEEEMKTYLFDALVSLKNVQSVTWKTATADEEWAQTIVLNALKTYTNLIKLDISLAHARISLPLHLFTNLREISVDEHGETADDLLNAETILNLARMLAHLPAGQLTSLAVHREWQGTRTTKALSLHDLFQFYAIETPPLHLTHLELQNCFIRLDSNVIPHLRHLTSLHLYNILEPCREPVVRGYRGIFSKLTAISDQVMEAQTAAGCTLTQFWESMSAEGLYLQEIKLNNIVSGFLQYLMEYSGLRKLLISTVLFLTGVESDVVARQFFGDPLENQRGSLEELVINATYEGLWCFGEHNAESIGKLGKLKVLSISISSPDLNRDEEAGDGEQRKDVVKLLLDTCAMYLTSLKHLILRPAILESHRGAKIGTRSYMHLNLVQKKIVGRLSEYRAPRGCRRLPVVSVWSGMFWPEWKGGAEGDGRGGGGGAWGYCVNPGYELCFGD